MANFHISESIRRTETPDGEVLLDVKRGRMFSLNLTGAKILQLIERGYDEPRIAEEISASYAVDLKLARNDVVEFIENMRAQYILEAVGAKAR